MPFAQPLVVLEICADYRLWRRWQFYGPAPDQEIEERDAGDSCYAALDMIKAEMPRMFAIILR